MWLWLGPTCHGHYPQKLKKERRKHATAENEPPMDASAAGRKEATCYFTLVSRRKRRSYHDDARAGVFFGLVKQASGSGLTLGRVFPLERAHGGRSGKNPGDLTRVPAPFAVSISQCCGPYVRLRFGHVLCTFPRCTSDADIAPPSVQPSLSTVTSSLPATLQARLAGKKLDMGDSNA